MKLLTFLSILLLALTPVKAGDFLTEDYSGEGYIESHLSKHNHVNSIVEKFNNQDRSERNLEKLFYKVHRKLLRSYSETSSLTGLTDKGYYNCLTGTILYAYILNQLDYNFRIISLDYHIYVLVRVDGKDVMIESTDPMYGFITGIDVKERIEKFMKAQDRTRAKEIKLEELPGLIMYNQAVVAFNNQDFKYSFNLLVDAFDYVETPKMKDLLKLSLGYLVTDESLSEEDLQKYLAIYLEIIRTEPVVYLSR